MVAFDSSWNIYQMFMWFNGHMALSFVVLYALYCIGLGVAAYVGDYGEIRFIPWKILGFFEISECKSRYKQDTPRHTVDHHYGEDLSGTDLVNYTMIYCMGGVALCVAGFIPYILAAIWGTLYGLREFVRFKRKVNKALTKKEDVNG